MTLAEVGALDPWQLRQVYNHKRDKRGNPVPPGGEAGETEKDAYFRQMRAFGWPERVIRRRWTEAMRGSHGPDPEH